MIAIRIMLYSARGRPLLSQRPGRPATRSGRSDFDRLADELRMQSYEILPASPTRGCRSCAPKSLTCSKFRLLARPRGGGDTPAAGQVRPLLVRQQRE
jgi:hypothetical protein